MEAKLVSLVEHYMSMHLHDNALFIAECLLAEAPSETNRHLLASVLIQAGRWKAAQAALRDTTTAPNRYLFARCCLEAGEFQEAEDALLTSGGVPPGTALESVIQGFQRAPFKLPNGAAGAHLLAVASLRLGRQEAASKYFMLALYLDPFLFSAFEQLCRMGYFPDPAQSFVQLRLGAHGQQSDRAMHVAEEKKLAAAAAAAAAASATAEAGGGGAHTRTAGVKRAAAVVAGVAASFESGAAAAVAIAAAAGDNAADAAAAAADDRSRRLVVPSPMLLSPITPAARLHMIMTSPAYDGSGSSEQLQMGQTGSSVSSNWTESSGIAGATPAAVQRNGGSGGAPLFGAPASAIALSLPPGGVSFSIGGGPPLFSGGGGGGGKLSSIAEEGAEGRGRRSGGSAQRGKAESSVSASAMGSSPDDAVVDAAQFRTDEEAEGWEEEEEGGGTGEEVQHAAIDAATSTPSNFSSAAAAPAHMRPPQGGAPTTVTRSAVAQQRRPTRARPPATAEKPLQLPRSRGARTGARGASSGAVGHDEMDEEGTPAASHSSSATSISSAVAFDWESGGRTGGHRGGGAVPLSGGGGGPLPVVQTLMQTFEEEEHTAAAAASNATASSPSLAQVHPAFASAVPSHRMGGAHRLMAMMSGGAAQHDSSSPSGAADATVTPSGTSSSSSSSLAFSSLSPIPAPFQNDSVTLMSRVLGGSLSMHADTAAAEHVAAQSLLRGPHGQQQRGSVPPFIRRATAFITPGEAAAQAASRLASAGVQVAGGPTFSTSHDFGYGGGGYSSDAAAASAAALRDLRERGLLRAAPASASARSPFLVDRSGGGGGGARRVLPFRWSGASGDSALAGGGRGSAPPSSAAAAHFMHSGGSGLQHHSHSSADDTGVTPTINFNFGEGNASSAGRRNDQDDGERGEDAPEEEQEAEEAMEEEGGDDVAAAAAAADESHASNAAAARGGGGGAHDAPRRGAPRVAAAPSRAAAAAVAAVVTSSAAAPPSSSSASSVRAYGMPGPHEQQPPRRYRGTGSPAGGSGSGVGRGTARAHLFGTPAPASAAAAVGGAVSAIAPIAQQQGGARGGGGGDAADAATASAPFSLNAAAAGSATALFAANAHRNTTAARATTAAAAPSASAGTGECASDSYPNVHNVGTPFAQSLFHKYLFTHTPHPFICVFYTRPPHCPHPTPTPTPLTHPRPAAAPFATPGVSNFPTSDRPWLVSAAAKGPFLRAVGEPLLAAATVAHESASPPLPALLSRGTVSVLSLLQQMGYIVRHLWKFESELALQCLDTSLPAHHARASFGLLCTGKARLDRGEYEAARDVFETLRRGSPHRVEGQELHSTALWHLKAVTELTVLAADIATAHPGTWQSLCVLGNAHSLKGDHKAAAAMFKRATEVDPWGAVYAYLLGGQEAIEMGKYEEAGEMLRVGLRKGEPRHYSGWHALGVVYLRTGRNDHALYHFKRATELHRYSPLLHVSYAMALAGQGKFAEALTSLTRALSLDPGHLQALYQRALVYSATGSHAEARADLLAVVARAPHEPAVLVQLGKQCKWVGRLDESVLYWNQALLLLRTDKDANVVKSLLSSVGSPAEAEDVLQI